MSFLKQLFISKYIVAVVALVIADIRILVFLLFIQMVYDDLCWALDDGAIDKEKDSK